MTFGDGAAAESQRGAAVRGAAVKARLTEIGDLLRRHSESPAEQFAKQDVRSEVGRPIRGLQPLRLATLFGIED